jgi:hypothetical protein
MGPYEIAMLGTQAVSLLSGANNIAAQNRMTVGMNNISLGYLQDQLQQLPEMTQLAKEASRDKMQDSMDILGMDAGIQWDKVNMSMDAMMDSNKFANYGQLGSRLDLITKQQQDKFESQVEQLRKRSNLEIAQAESFQIAEESRLENQRKLLKKQNQYARKRDTMFEALFG